MQFMGPGAMRAHQILENLISPVAFESDTESLDTLAALKSILSEAVSFEFPCMPSEEHRDFGIGLFENGLLCIPFPKVFFSLKTWNGDHLGFAAEQEYGYIKIAPVTKCRDFYYPITSITIDTNNSDGCKWYYGIGVGSTADESFTIGNALTLSFVGALVLLISKGVQQRIEPAPSKLNAARLKKGRPPIGEVRIISVGSDYRPAKNFIGGTHASPKIHWRRGHFATLNRGTEAEKVIVKPPCIVGANENCHLPAPKDYQISAKG